MSTNLSHNELTDKSLVESVSVPCDFKECNNQAEWIVILKPEYRCECNANSELICQAHKDLYMAEWNIVSMYIECLCGKTVGFNICFADVIQGFEKI